MLPELLVDLGARFREGIGGKSTKSQTRDTPMPDDISKRCNASRSEKNPDFGGEGQIRGVLVRFVLCFFFILSAHVFHRFSLLWALLFVGLGP